MTRLVKKGVNAKYIYYITAYFLSAGLLFYSQFDFNNLYIHDPTAG